jgi:hypothetical protein
VIELMWKIRDRAARDDPVKARLSARLDCAQVQRKIRHMARMGRGPGADGANGRSPVVGQVAYHRLCQAAGRGMSKWEMLRRVRLGNLRKLLRARCGPVLPDDDPGREYLHELLLAISSSPHASIKMQNAIDVWAPWLNQQEADRMIERINRTPIRQRMPTARQLGERLHLTNGERERFKLWTIAPYHMGKQELLAQRRAKAKARMRLSRQLRGIHPRAEYEATSLSRSKPWLAAGLSRRTWYRRRGTSPCAVSLKEAENGLVPQEKSQSQRKEHAMEDAMALKPNTPMKAEKSQSADHAPNGATARRATRTELCHRGDQLA